MALICRPALLSQQVVPLAGGFAVDGGLGAGFLLLTAGTVAAAAVQAAFLLPGGAAHRHASATGGWACSTR